MDSFWLIFKETNIVTRSLIDSALINNQVKVRGREGGDGGTYHSILTSFNHLYIPC
jgi:hypothetical protein